jgi:hypothetical protein
MDIRTLDSMEIWMVKSNMEHNVPTEGVEVVAARLRSQGYMRVAEGVEDAAKEQARWSKIGTAGGGEYTVWKRDDGIHNVTKDGKPPTWGTGGYPVLESLLSLKGRNLD